MNPLPHYADVLRAVDGMRNPGAIALVIAGFVLALLVAAAGIATQSGIAMTVFGLLAWLIAGFGSNAAGILLMHQALDQPPPTVHEVVFGGVTSFIKLLAIFLILALGVVTYTLSVTVLLFVCKLPYLGPLLFAVVLPVLIVVSGAAYIAVIVGAGLMAPAVWGGATVPQALLELLAIVRERLIETLVRFFLLILLTLVVFGVAMLILGVGVGYTIGLSAGIIGSEVGGGFGSLMDVVGRDLPSGGSGHAYAAVFGFGLLYAFVLGAGYCVATMGNITIYLAVTDRRLSGESGGLSLSLAGAGRVAAVLERRRKMGANPPARSCPACETLTKPDDTYCGHCGQRLS